jgi:hypothetical protein
VTVRDLIIRLGDFPLDAVVVYDRYSDVSVMKAEEITLVEIKTPKENAEWVQRTDDWRLTEKEKESMSVIKAVNFPGN